MNRPQVPVSVIIPCYRCVDTIERAVQSVASQTNLPAEIVLIDDFSGDGTLDMLRQLESCYPPGWIKVVAMPRNRGPASARNAGWSAASQTYIAFLDSDDTWHAQKIELQYNWMERHPDVTLCGHAMAHIDVQTSALPSVVYVGADLEFTPVSKSKILLKNRFSTPTVMLRREVKHRFAEDKRFSEDYLLWVTISCLGGKTHLCDWPLAFMHKAAFGASGLSAQLWNMERGELDTYHRVWRGGGIGWVSYILLHLYSVVRFLRRLIVSAAWR